MFHTQLLLSVFMPVTSAIFFDVKRYAADPKDGNEPYRPINYFLNKQRRRSICLFMFCWRHYGNCKSSTDCCECKCKNKSTYYSEPLGCKAGNDLTSITKDVGKACYFATKKFGFSYVPLFHNRSRFVDIELDLPKRNFRLNDEKTSCTVGAIHDYDYHGHKLLFDRNRCSELFQVYQRHGKQYLKFHSSNVSIWNSFRGRLLSVEIDCFSRRQSQTFSSCLLFQVEGKYIEEVDGEGPPEIPAGYTCPTVKNVKTTNNPLTKAKTTIQMDTATSTAFLKSTSVQSSKATTTSTTSELKSSSASMLQPTILARITPRTTLQPAIIHPTKLPTTILHPTKLPTTILRPTKLPTTILHPTKLTSVPKQQNVLKMVTMMMKEKGRSPKSTEVTVIFLDPKDTLTGTTIGILTGLGTGLAIVMICVIIWILVKKRKEIFMSKPVNTQIFNPEVNPFNDNYHYDVPKVKPMDVIPDFRRQNSCSSFNFAPIKDDLTNNSYNTQYSYICEKEGMDETDFESKENTILLKSRQGIKKSGSMCKRPLPEKPMESGNPYYSVASLPSDEVDDKASEANDLYTLYSTIDDLKGS